MNIEVHRSSSPRHRVGYGQARYADRITSSPEPGNGNSCPTCGINKAIGACVSRYDNLIPVPVFDGGRKGGPTLRVPARQVECPVKTVHGATLVRDIHAAITSETI